MRLRYWPAVPETREEPGVGPEIEPGECTQCGVELDADEVAAEVKDAEQDAAERAQEMRAEAGRDEA